MIQLDHENLEAINSVLLKCCPPDNSTIDNRNAPRDGVTSTEPNSHILENLYVRRLIEQKYLDEHAVLDPEHRSVLEEIGLAVFCDVVKMYRFAADTSQYPIGDFAALLSKVLPFIPKTRADLAGTPYTNISGHDIADDRMNALAKAFDWAASCKSAVIEFD